MNSKIIILFFVFGMLSFYPLVSADIIMPGTKIIGGCHKISNIEDYSDYYFILYGEIMTLSQIEQDECFSFYKFEHPIIYAIKKTDIEINKLNNFSEYSDKLIPSDIKLYDLNIVSDTSPLVGRTIVLEINGINDNELDIKKTKIIYSYYDGTSEEKYFEDQELYPQPSRGDLPPWWLYIIVPIIAIIIIAAILKRRKKK